MALCRCLVPPEVGTIHWLDWVRSTSLSLPRRIFLVSWKASTIAGGTNELADGIRPLAKPSSGVALGFRATRMG